MFECAVAHFKKNEKGKVISVSLSLCHENMPLVFGLASCCKAWMGDTLKPKPFVSRIHVRDNRSLHTFSCKITHLMPHSKHTNQKSHFAHCSDGVIFFFFFLKNKPIFVAIEPSFISYIVMQSFSVNFPIMILLC